MGICVTKEKKISSKRKFGRNVSVDKKQDVAFNETRLR